MRHFSGAFVLLWLLTAFSPAQTTIDALQREIDGLKLDKEKAAAELLQQFHSKLSLALQNSENAYNLWIEAGGSEPTIDSVVLPPKVEDTADNSSDADSQNNQPENNSNTNKSDSASNKDKDSKSSGAKNGKDNNGKDAKNDPSRPKKPKSRHDTLEEKKEKEALFAQMQIDFKDAVLDHCRLIDFVFRMNSNPPDNSARSEWEQWFLQTIKKYSVYKPLEISGISVAGSPILNYLKPPLPDEAEGREWSLRSTPEIYKKNFLDKYRMQKAPNLLDAWDTYIGLKEIDAKNPEKWLASGKPDLLFQRALDDYDAQPTVNKLSTLLALLRSSPGIPGFEEKFRMLQERTKAYKEKQ